MTATMNDANAAHWAPPAKRPPPPVHEDPRVRAFLDAEGESARLRDLAAAYAAARAAHDRSLAEEATLRAERGRVRAVIADDPGPGSLARLREIDERIMVLIAGRGAAARGWARAVIAYTGHLRFVATQAHDAGYDAISGTMGTLAAAEIAAGRTESPDAERALRARADALRSDHRPHRERMDRCRRVVLAAEGEERRWFGQGGHLAHQAAARWVAERERAADRETAR